MYSIRYGNALIYDPRLPEYRILQGKLNRAVNKAGSLVFSLPAGHPGYGTPKRLKGNVSVFDDEEEIFRGRVLDDQDELNRNRRYTCEGCLAFLNDSTVRPYSWQGSVPGYLGFLLDQHNEQVEAERKIYLGVVTVTDPNDYITRASDQYPTTWKEIEEKLLKNNALQGYLIPRIQDGRIYVDYLSEITASNDQEARFGSNLLDLSWLRKGQDIATVIVPVGHKDETTETRLTIKEVNAGKDYLEDQEAIEKYGRITKTVFYDDVTLASNLLRKGREDLAKGVESAEMIQIKAADLAKAGHDISAFRFAEMLRVKSGLHGLETEMLVSSLDTDLLHPEQSTLALGALSSSFTSSQADTWKKKDEELNAEISNREAAQRDLAERIANSSGMFITAEQQPDGSVIYYAHNKRRLDESDIVLKFTMEALAISTDGGESYPYGMDVSGIAILNRIFAESVDASSGTIHGTFEVKDTAGNTVFLINADTGRVYIGSESVTTAGGEDLQTVLNGYADAAKVYTLEASDNIIIQSADGTLPSSDVVFAAYVKDGAEPRQAYSGRFRIEETQDGTTWNTVYTSQADESRVSWSLLETILAESGVKLLAEGEETLDAGIRDISRIRCTLYASGGTTEILDRQTVAITSERAGLAVILSNETVTIAADNAGNVGDYLECYTDIQVYYGTRDVTASAAISYSPGPGVQADYDDSIRRCSVSHVDGADGYVDFTVAFQGTEIYRRFTVSKAMKGENGADGIDGIDGEDGLPGVSSYFHLAYANSQDGTVDFSLSDASGRKYIGTYTDANQADSTDPSKYEWMLTQGIKGDQGIPGTNGTDGKTQYLHIAYAMNSTGTEGFSPTASTGKTYIGTYVDFTQADSTDPSKYAWSLIKGDKGDTGAKGDKGDTGAKGDKGDKGDAGEAGQDALMPAILCDKSASISKDRTETLTMTAIIYDSTGNDVDPSGNIYRYAWYMARDGETEDSPVGRGKQLVVRVDALLCEDYAGVYFETVEDDADFRLLADAGVELLAADSEPLLIA